MQHDVLMVVGSLNRGAGHHGVGLSILAFDAARGTARPLCEETGIDDPSFLSVDPVLGCIYANSEVSDGGQGGVSAYRFDAAARRLRLLGRQPSLGAFPAHNSLDPRGRRLLVANYGAGPADAGPDRAIAILALRADGGLAAPTGVAAPRGHGLDPDRQDRSHPHCVLPSPDGRFAIVADLGLDAILTFGIGPDGCLSPEPIARLDLPPGAGPRHLAFHPEGRRVVVIRELDSTLTLLSFDPETGRLAGLHDLPTVPGAARPGNFCSDVRIHPNGRFVYGANRGHDSVALWTLDADGGRLAFVEHRACGGRTPRHLAIDPTGRILVVANQGSDALSLFAIDPENGTLSPAGPDIPVGTPMCVGFMASGLA